MTNNRRENSIEKYLIDQLSCLPSPLLCIKFQPDHRAGMPDRLVLLPDGKVVWVEMKTEGGSLSELQKYRHTELRKMGHRVEVLWTADDVDQFVSGLSKSELD